MHIKKIVIPVILMSMIALSGCGKKQIIEDPNAKYNMQSLSDTELKKDTFYVKDGSRFFEPYAPNGAKDVFWLGKDKSLVPSVYIDGNIVYPTQETSLDGIELTRYEYIGYSIGVYNATIDDDGYICFDSEKDMIPGCDAFNALKGLESASIRVVSINDQPVTPSMISDYGIFTGMEQDGLYQFGLYAGSYYHVVNAKADAQMFETYETIMTDDAYTTKNGYLAIDFPEDLKSGYYYIPDSGVFKYYAYERGEKDDADTDMNEPYYSSEAEKMAAYMQQYVVNVQTRTSDVGFTVTYDPYACNDEDITCILSAPDGTQYTMEAKEGTAYVEIADVMAGRWLINLLPKDLQVEISVDSTSTSEDALSEEKVFKFEEDEENIQFYATYEGDGSVWGIVTDEKGVSQTMDVDTNESSLSTTYAFVGAGEYTVTIYHYNDTEIKDIDYQSNSENEEVELIIIEE